MISKAFLAVREDRLMQLAGKALVDSSLEDLGKRQHFLHSHGHASMVSVKRLVAAKMRIVGRPASMIASVQNAACRASSAACRVNFCTRKESLAARTIRPNNSAPSSSLCRYQLSRQARFRISGLIPIARLRRVQTASGQPLDFLVERDDRQEVVLVAHRHLWNDQRAEVRKIAGGVQDDFRLRPITVDSHLNSS